MAGPLTDGALISRWRRTRFLAASAILSTAALSALFLLANGALDTWRWFGVPFGLFGATIIVPLFSAIVIFWVAIRQRRIDQASGIFRE